MIRVGRINDKELIKEAFTNSRVWGPSTDDGAGSPEDFQPFINESTIYLGVYDDDVFCGVFLFVPRSFVCYEVHTRLLPCAFGAKAVDAVQKASEWMWAGTTAWRIVTEIPNSNSHAVQLAVKAGMAVYGLNPHSWGKDGVLHDCLLLGMSRPLGV